MKSFIYEGILYEVESIKELDRQITDNMIECLYEAKVRAEGDIYITKLLSTELVEEKENQKWFVLGSWKRQEKFMKVKDLDRFILTPWIEI